MWDNVHLLYRIISSTIMSLWQHCLPALWPRHMHNGADLGNVFHVHRVCAHNSISARIPHRLPPFILWNENFMGQYWCRRIFWRGLQNRCAFSKEWSIVDAVSTLKMNMTATARISLIEMGLKHAENHGKKLRYLKRNCAEKHGVSMRFLRAICLEIFQPVALPCAHTLKLLM